VIDFDAVLGGQPVTVLVPGPDDLGSFRTLFPAGGFYGLDVESTYMTDLAQFDPDFRIRTVQVATEGYAWVLRLSDPACRAAAVGLLADPTVSFASHSNMDVLSVATRLGVDITARNVDTLMLARMADPNRDQDRDLKTLATAYGMPELAEADQALYARFLELWEAERQRLLEAARPAEAMRFRRNAARPAVEVHGWATIPASGSRCRSASHSSRNRA